MDIINQHFVPASLVQAILTEDGGAVLLDLQTDRYLGIDQMGMLMWTLVTTGSTPQEVARQITEQYTVDTEELLQSDIIQFIQNMEAENLLFLADRNFSMKHACSSCFTSRSLQKSWPACVIPFLSRICFKRSAHEWLEAWLLLKWVHSFLQHGRFIDLAGRLYALPSQQVVTVENPDVQRLARLVQSAAAWQSFKAVCLHQTLALGFMLRQRALEADLVIGVSTFPFFAHAWLKSGTDILYWDTNLGPNASLQRLQQLSIIFCTEWLHDEGIQNGGKQ